ncbi:MAG: flagellar hook-length control protein FliK [Lachnospiraceae bacterium]|nr:flagellar hook-length control protein FliK [Lachnospiraceae bacterium]
MNISNNSVASDIINSNISNYAKNSGNVSEDISIKNVGQVKTAGEINLQELKPGDVFSGEILDINKNNVTILLKDNSVINALLKEALSLNIGEKLIFQIKDKTDGTVFIKPLQQDMVSKELISKSLNAAGLTVNDKNSMIVSSLINSGQPIDRQTIINYIKLTNEFGMENINKLIDMNKQGISISQENIETYERYQNSNHQLSKDVFNFSKGFSDYIGNVISQGMNEKEILNLNGFLKQVSDIINENQTEAKIEINSKNNPEINQETNNAVNIEKNVQNELKTNNPIQTSVLNNQAEELKTILNMEGMSKTEMKADLEFNQLVKDIENLIIKRTQINSGISIDKESQLQSLEKEISIIKDKIENFFKEKFMFDIKSDIKDDSVIKKTIEENYEKLFKLTELVKEVISNDKGSMLKESAMQLNNNLSFMNELNNFESYVQIPVKMSEQDANGELYVYSKKKNERKEGDELTAFLHLDMESLGVTDVSVKLKENGVEVYFTLDNEVSEKIVLEHIDELSNRLEQKGYTSKIYAKTVEVENTEDFNPLTPVNKDSEKTTSIKRYTFDIRT